MENSGVNFLHHDSAIESNRERRTNHRENPTFRESYRNQANFTTVQPRALHINELDIEKVSMPLVKLAKPLLKQAQSLDIGQHRQQAGYQSKPVKVVPID